MSHAGNGKPTMNTWIAVFISIVGLYLLSDADIRDLEMGKPYVHTYIYIHMCAFYQFLAVMLHKNT
ncbi:hypothetical protein EON63_14520 [archaeon]|nr:MAG: hypothetical protein EON63_14520 [archaeon]